MSKREKVVKITGRVVSRASGEGVAGLRVEAWDKDLVWDDMVGSAVTDAAGAFLIEFDGSHFKEWFFDRRPDLFFKIFQSEGLILDTRDSVLWNAGDGPTAIVIEVRMPDGKPAEVRGAVRLADDSPAAGLTVSAFDCDLRSKQLLGEARTDKQGFYQIRYFARQFQRREKGGADLILQARGSDGSPLAASQVLFDAPPSAEVNLTIPAEALPPPSLFEKIRLALEPLLGDLKAEELEEDQEHQDLSFLSGETGFAAAALARFALAHGLAREGVEPEFWFALLGGPVFRYDGKRSLRGQLKAVSDSLPSLDAAAVRKTLVSSLNRREIAETFRGRIPDWTEAFLRLAARRAVKESDEPSFLKSALEDAGIKGADEQEALSLLLIEHGQLTPALFESLSADDSFAAESIADLRASFQLAELTRGDFSVVKMLKEEFGIRRPEKIRALAKKSEGEWVDLVSARHAAGEIKLPFEVAEVAGRSNLPEAEVYGKMLERRFREAFPTAAFAGGLVRALEDGNARGLRNAETLGRFLERHENFELLKTPVDEFLDSGLDPDLRSLAKDEDFKREVKAVQRVFKLAPTFEATNTLLANGLRSAHQVYRLGRTEFVRRYGGRDGFTAETARLAWNRAADTHAAVLTVAADLQALDNGALPLALRNGDGALSTFPNWNNLFQTGDLCDCEHCRSVLSPAAYFTDLLMFLKDRKAAATGLTVKDVLFRRRRDLGDIELNCENALTPLPYIDVVCEVLEDVVAAGENDLELAGLTSIAGNSAASKAAVANALAAHGVSLGADFSLSQVNPSSAGAWVARGDAATYLLKKKSTANFFAEVLRNTKASAAELRAYPQYVNPKAYAKLGQARYPAALPFDLFGEEVKAALLKTDLRRWELMRALRGAAPPNDPTDGDIAAEYFGISVNTDSFRFNGVMTSAQRATLLTHPSLANVTGLAFYQQAVQQLFKQPGWPAAVKGLPSGFAFPAAITGAPHNIPITHQRVSFDEKSLILNARPTDAEQQVLWGEAAAADWLDKVGNVKSFLRKTGLEYDELLALLDLPFINPDSDIAVHHPDDSCDTDKKVIRVLDAAKLDRIHRFLRLWRKLKTWKMWELDLAIRNVRVGGGTLGEPFLVNLFRLCEARNKLGDRVTVEETLALLDNLNTTTHFTKPHERRGDGLYQRLFLNKRLVQPPDPAFEAPTGAEQLSDHMPALLAALGMREADLLVLKGLTKASDGAPYLNDDLDLVNLSFLWRHAWLSKLLKFDAQSWATLLKVFGQDLSLFGSPAVVLEFLEMVEQVKSSGFTPDELNWLLAADRSAKAAVKEADAARFLAALRTELQAIRAENDPAQYDFLTVLPPTDEGQLVGLLTTLLQKLNRDEAGVGLFLTTLRGGVRLEAAVQDLPAGFTFPAPITGAPNHIPVQYDEPNLTLHFKGLMTAAQRTTLLTDASLSAVTQKPAYVNAVEELFQQSQAAPTSYAFTEVEAVLPGGVTLPTALPSLPIRYNSATSRLGFIGVMTDAERLALIAAGNPAPMINELFDLPRLSVKFYEPVFTAALAVLPPSADFKALLPEELAAKIAYDTEQRSLRFTGIMRRDERAALDALVLNYLPSEIAYHNAVNSLATQPHAAVPPDDRIWLTDSDLDAAQPASDTLAKRLVNAATKALGYLSKTLAANHVVQQSAGRLGLTAALTRRLLTHYSVLPGPTSSSTTSVLSYLTGAFQATTGAVDYATLGTAFKGWFWANRAAAILKKWKITLEESERLDALPAGAQLLDFSALPLDDSGTPASAERLLRTGRLLRLRDTLPEDAITLLEVLGKLGTYSTAGDFAADVQRLNDAWSAADVEQLVTALDIAYPAGYLLAESWERLRRAFHFLDNLNAGAGTVKLFAAASVNDQHARALKELLRSKFGAETWLTLSAEIQDALRERKRDALAAYLLTRPKPADAPSGKWENTNDLYAYYLLDVEMSACQLTSRLVQAAGSVQLFVQRCFMGLEPAVEVRADGARGDSAWRWWKWMRKYRVWEANRKVFLWPENWIEPELKKDRSQFFKELEEELLQNEINQPTVEMAFAKYLEKLDGVARLEIAGFYHEDDGDNSIVHVFGRTTGAEPHLYYYRRYDYRQWTPWEKVEADIQGDYLIPAVVDRRLFLFWPVFMEVPDERGNDSPITVPGTGQPVTPVKTKKLLRVQMAVTEYRQGKWTPKRVSKDYAESSSYDVEIVKKHYRFFPVDRSEVDGRFGIKFDGYSLGRDEKRVPVAVFNSRAFEIAGCKGVPQLTSFPGYFATPIRPEEGSTAGEIIFSKWEELPQAERSDSPENDFTLENLTPDDWSGSSLTRILLETPGEFKVSPPWNLSYFDKLWLDGLVARGADNNDRYRVLTGSWLPFFYHDQKRAFFVLPSLKLGPLNEGVRSYYPELKRARRQFEERLAGEVHTTLLSNFRLAELTSDERAGWELELWRSFPMEPPPPYTDEQVIDLTGRLVMRHMHFHIAGLAPLALELREFHFKNFYHPFVCDFTSLLYNPLKGIPALMSRATQLKDTGFRFRQSYKPTQVVVEPPTEDFHPREVVDFTSDGAYSSYNWEIFFHAPLLIANSLSRNQRFEEAREWYHFIFNPLGVESPAPGGPAMSKYWITKPFFETTDSQYVQQRVDNILRMLAGDTDLMNSTPQAMRLKKALEDQVLDWRTNPFEPHRLANYRTVAYQKTVVMKYLDNLIAWGDYLFSQDSMESVNEATQLYVMAAEILGPRPMKIAPRAKPPVRSFNELEPEFENGNNRFGNPIVELENLVPVMTGTGPSGSDPAPLPTLYFCIPQNDKLLAYWDTVADRLYKIRHCMNIEGVVRKLALFEPPIDPAALVKAAAAGLDIGAALSDLNAPLPLYRFDRLLQKANELCGDVKALGGALLAALEKKDAEAVGTLRQGQEIRLLEAMRAVREKQIEEAKENLEAAKKSKELAEVKKKYYASRLFMDPGEIAAAGLNAASLAAYVAATIADVLAGVMFLIPDFKLGASGAGGSPHVTADPPAGSKSGNSSSRIGNGMYNIANMLSQTASWVATMAGYVRRKQEWDFQAGMADKEREQIEKSIAAAELRITVAEKELHNLDIQIENAKAMDAFMRSKYTNEELYQWQVGQISGVYFQSYKLAYDLAKRAERCFRFELGIQQSSYINFGYWDSLRKGLLSGERLQYDLRRLETAYMERNRREFELTKQVSLALLAPLALVKLRETGRCFFRLPEELFDLDYPGHYYRRIKSVGLTLPCVVGPSTTIPCTLRLLQNSIRVSTANGDNGYPRNTDDQGLPADDARFVENNIPVKAMAVSGAQNDSGLFELNFHDERYLPFEGAGVVSEWSLELFSDLPANNPDPAEPDFGKPLRQFDYGSITDAILQIRYTAREDAGPFKNGAITHLRDYFSQDGGTPSLQLFDLRRDFPTQWHRFVHPPSPATANVFEFEMSPSLFALRDAEKTLKVNTVWLLARCADAGSYDAVITIPVPTPGPATILAMTLAPVNQYGGLHVGQRDASALGIKITLTDAPTKWQVQMTRPGGGSLQEDPVKKVMEVVDVLLVLAYEWDDPD